MTRRLLQLLAALLLAGCVNLGTVSPDAAALDPKEGYVAVSISHSGYGWLETLSIDYRKRGETLARTLYMDARSLYGDPQRGALLRDPDKRMAGELKLVHLEPGEYEVVGWRAFAGRGNQGLTIVTTNWEPVDPPPPFSFKVTRGRVTYIGNLDVHFPAPKRYGWRVLDERQRDLSLLRSRFPASQRLSTEVELMTPQGGAAREHEGAAKN